MIFSPSLENYLRIAKTTCILNNFWPQPRRVRYPAPPVRGTLGRLLAAHEAGLTCLPGKDAKKTSFSQRKSLRELKNIEFAHANGRRSWLLLDLLAAVGPLLAALGPLLAALGPLLGRPSLLLSRSWVALGPHLGGPWLPSRVGHQKCLIS